MDVLSLNLLPCCHISLSYTMHFDIKVIHQISQTTQSHTSCCHYCNVDFMLLHNITCYTKYSLSCIHVNTTTILNITCTLVATSMILGRLECNHTTFLLTQVSYKDHHVVILFFTLPQNEPLGHLAEDGIGLTQVHILTVIRPRATNGTKVNNIKHDLWSSNYLRLGVQMLNLGKHKDM